MTWGNRDQVLPMYHVWPISDQLHAWVIRLHVVDMWSLAEVWHGGQALSNHVQCSLSHIHVTHDLPAAPCESFMMTSSNGNIFRVTGHLSGPGEFPTQRPVTRSFDVFFGLHPNKRLSKQWWGWWFETLSRVLWRHRNVAVSNQPVLPIDTWSRCRYASWDLWIITITLLAKIMAGFVQYKNLCDNLFELIRFLIYVYLGSLSVFLVNLIEIGRIFIACEAS